MYVDYENKVAFFANPRTGTRSIKEILTRQFNFVLVDSHHSTVISTPNSRWGGQGQTLYNKHLRFGGWKTFTVVRNHFDRVASFWRLSHEERMPDLKSDEDTTLMIRSITQLSTNLKMGPTGGNPIGYMYYPWTCHATHVLKYENLEHELLPFLFEAGYDISDLKVPHIGVTKMSSRSYKDYFNERTRERLEKMCGWEMMMYGYTW
jgi:hypothetical protein